MAAFTLPDQPQVLDTEEPKFQAATPTISESPVPIHHECLAPTSCDCPAPTPCVCDAVPPAHAQDGCDQDYFSPPGANTSYLPWIQAWARGVILSTLPETWALWMCSNVSRGRGWGFPPDPYMFVI